MSFSLSPMPIDLHDAHFRRGARDMLAFGPALAAWGIVTGVAMTQSGLGVGPRC